MMPRFFRRMRKPAHTGRPWYRPRLDPLEDRSLPSVASPAIPVAPESLAAPLAPAVTDAPDVPLTVAVNAPPSTIDLRALFAKTGGLDLTLPPGLSFCLVGNTNPDLVTAKLADDDLVLSYAANQTGKAKVTVAATDAAGASVHVTFVITVGAAAPKSSSPPASN
jgi:hypothetical protein